MRALMYWCFILLLLTYFTACQTVKEETKPVMSWNNKDWDSHLLSEIKKSKPLLSVNFKDTKDYCPKYNSLNQDDRAMVLMNLIVAMAKFESNYKPATFYKESFNDNKGKPVISRGLLQLSIESANGYGCGIKAAEELHDPKTNLSCAIKIITKWAVKDESLMGVSGYNFGCGRYWSVCRASSRAYQPIRSTVKSLPLCN